MGWNQGYTIMESQVISLYDLGVLNKEVLNALMEPFKGTDIDSGGSYDLQTKDGKSVEEVICFIMEPEKYKEVMDDFVPDPEEPEWNEGLYYLYREITKKEWNFW